MLEVISHNDTLVVDSRLIAEELGIQHPSFKDNIVKYKKDLEEFGRVGIETEPLETLGGKQYLNFYYLNEDQAYFIMTLSRNTEQVVTAKKNLIKAFKEAREKLEKKAPQSLFGALKLAVILEEDKVKLQEENKMLNLHNSSLKVEVNELNEINGELTEFKEDVSGYERFVELLDITKNDIKNDEYLNGITITQFLVEWNNDVKRMHEKVDQDDWKTVAKRASMYYRLLEGKTPSRNNKCQYVFVGKKVAYIIATIKLVNDGI